MSTPSFQRRLAGVAAFQSLVGVEPQERVRRGYGHTLREITQQPELWRTTMRDLLGRSKELPLIPSGEKEEAPSMVLLTGSGSSLHVAECLAPDLQRKRGVPVRAVGSGEVLLAPEAYLPQAPSLMVSFARSGESPESTAALEAVLRERPACSHVIITCNAEGRLARRYAGHPRVATVVLDPRSCDRSLVMTSSFTSMAVATLSLSRLDEEKRFRDEIETLATLAEAVLVEKTDTLAQLARSRFGSALFLGSGGRWGAAREAGLKLLEMTAGRVWTMAETFLGVRHGPMSAIHPDTAVVAFLSTDEVTRAYEMDVLRELEDKGIGAARVIVGPESPSRSTHDVTLADPRMAELGEAPGALFDVLVGQVLAFFRCLEEGLAPDAPSPEGIITRVVGEFTLHPRKD